VQWLASVSIEHCSGYAAVLLLCKEWTSTTELNSADHLKVSWYSQFQCLKLAGRVLLVANLQDFYIGGDKHSRILVFPLSLDILDAKE
jgi:hypothetical protein